MAKFNGWRNYQTWRINSGLGQDWNNKCIELAERARQQDSPEKWLAEELQIFVMNQCPLTGDMYGDLLQDAIESADFREIAESILEELGN